ncbi:sterol desaturase family protein [Agrobacterium rhizogenes]|uniref:sterol desaturase family protein n=1 Tax=Rhizobium rhizogenes TaxID=359 RepID=UPI00055BFE94|nr:sterol desaturase family protein [Rhizobium rhizogenes]NTF81958.1 sterol desaturase family protein [Rhizobium rhizogenes]NTH77975.1 sterol desaturase family protein [Rhizobium rhizogenes]NTH83983.1 sterol desaturase family protein [Rhizobium rhizogenes]
MTSKNSSRLYAAVSSLLWPAIFCAGLTGSYFAFQSDMHLLWFNVTYFSIVAIIALFERLMPYEETWLESDGETFNNIAHTLLSKGGVQIAAAIGTSFPMAMATVAQPFLSHKANIWPEQWPMALQVVLGLVIAEFGLYLAHRLAHEYLSLWRFHALHHSVERLWVINTGRFHIIDSLFKIALGQIPLYLLGAPLPVFLWIGAVTAFIGLLTHCNIDVRTGPLDWILSTPRLHRWHHSKLLAEGNTNYGENLVIWDQILGTYYNPPRPSSTDIGITGKVADSFVAQLVQPFSKKGAKQIIGKKPKEVRDKEELAAAKAASRRKQAEEPIRKSG